jgi:hypothetical protein
MLPTGDAVPCLRLVVPTERHDQVAVPLRVGAAVDQVVAGIAPGSNTMVETKHAELGDLIPKTYDRLQGRLELIAELPN